MSAPHPTPVLIAPEQRVTHVDEHLHLVGAIQRDLRILLADAERLQHRLEDLERLNEARRDLADFERGE